MIILLPERVSMFPVLLADIIENERITVTYLVPSALTMMVRFGKLMGRDFSALRAILFAGEVFPIRYFQQLAAIIPQADYYNLYGPTETNVCTYYKVQPSDLDPQRSEPLPIGIACGNFEVFAVDESGQRVTEPGQEGELWVSGPCVSQGYWGDPEKTAASFVRNEQQSHSHGTAYRTGDIVCLADDRRNWNYVGRFDHMVKTRGYRVELGEIESALKRHPQVLEAVVVAVPDDLFGNALKAFVVTVDQNAPTAAQLAADCKQRLPHYMIPQSIHFLESIPVTSSGKVDRMLLTGS